LINVPVELTRRSISRRNRITLFSDDQPGRFFRIIKFWMDETSGIALALKTGVPSYQVEDEEGRIHLLLHLPIEEKDEGRWCLWRPDQEGFDSTSIFDALKIAEAPQKRSEPVLDAL
jgi:hypothetical protein